jgi:hypothetical protein
MYISMHYDCGTILLLPFAASLSVVNAEASEDGPADVSGITSPNVLTPA